MNNKTILLFTTLLFFNFCDAESGSNATTLPTHCRIYNRHFAEIPEADWVNESDNFTTDTAIGTRYKEDLDCPSGIKTDYKGSIWIERVNNYIDFDHSISVNLNNGINGLLETGDVKNLGICEYGLNIIELNLNFGTKSFLAEYIIYSPSLELTGEWDEKCAEEG